MKYSRSTGPSRIARGRVFLSVTCAFLFFAPGCTSGPAPVQFQSRPIPDASAQDVFDAAVPIMRQEFGRINVDRGGLQIVSAPQEYRATDNSGTARDLVHAPSTMRRVATLRIHPRDREALAEIRIDLERKDTGRRAAQQSDSRLTDVPSYTPIQRDMATSEEQNTLWVKVRRDLALERALLDELRDWAASKRSPDAAPRAATDAKPQPPPP